MPPCAAAGKKPVTEETLHSLGWTFHAESQTWNFHGTTIPCLARSSITLEELLLKHWAVLEKSMAHIEKSMGELGVNVPDRPGTKRVPVDFHQFPGSVPKRPGLEYPSIGAPDELHKFLDAIVDTARKQGARVQITLDPTRGQAFDPLRIVKQMLEDRCPNCRGQHGN